MTFATIDALRESLAQPAQKVRTPEYTAKMMHAVPKSTVVERMSFVLQRCAGKRVLELGASGDLHVGIVKAAAHVLGIDRVDGGGVIGFDLDDVSDTMAPPWRGYAAEIVVCGEVFEHLSNPGWCLTRLRRDFTGAPLIVTVPNAFSVAGLRHMEDGTENVNIDHVAWYSYRTLRTLLERAGYAIQDFHWYHGEPYTAEGLIVVAI